MRIKKLIIASTILSLGYSIANADPINLLAENNSPKTKTSKKNNTKTSPKKATNNTTKKSVKATSTTKVTKQPIVAKPTPTTVSSNGLPRLSSQGSYVINLNNNNVVINKNSDTAMPIASITKLMTAMVLLDSNVNLDDYVTISQDDVDDFKNTTSRLKVGMQLRRRDLLLLALMSSENRASHALARTTYKGGIPVFVKQMNAKAKSIGMTKAFFEDPTGLSPNNRASAQDLAKMVKTAHDYPLIREDSTTKAADVMLSARYTHRYINSDPLVRGDNFTIEVSKTGFINEAGHCLVLYSVINSQPYAMVFLSSRGKGGRVTDALAVRNYISKN